jgi:hypothetical protein
MQRCSDDERKQQNRRGRSERGEETADDEVNKKEQRNRGWKTAKIQTRVDTQTRLNDEKSGTSIDENDD